MLCRLRAATVASCLAATSGCTVDSEEGMTSLGGSTVPGGSTVSTTVGTTMSTGTASGGSEDTASPGTTDDPTGDPGTGTSGTGAPTTGGSGETGEQPASGPYSDCLTVVECFGATTCTLVMPTAGFCTNTCAAPAECAAAPGGTGTPACLPDPATSMLVCALDCAADGACPGGMDCQPFGATMVCV